MPWRSWRSDLSFCSVVSEDIGEGTKSCNPKDVTDIAWDLRIGPVSLGVVLEHFAWALLRRASSAQDSLSIHTLETPRVIHLSDSTSRDKAFFQCLACLEDIRSPILSSLATGQPEACFQKVLQPDFAHPVLPPLGHDTDNHEVLAMGSLEEDPVLEHPSGPSGKAACCQGHPQAESHGGHGFNDAQLVPLPALKRIPHS